MTDPAPTPLLSIEASLMLVHVEHTRFMAAAGDIEDLEERVNAKLAELARMVGHLAMLSIRLSQAVREEKAHAIAAACLCHEHNR